MQLEAKNLSVKIADKIIFSNITPQFSEGKCTAIIGANGAGKSTLLRVLAALNSNYDGEILLDGVNIRKLNRKKIARHLAILPQTMQFPPDLTVSRLVDFGRFPYRNLFSGNSSEDREITSWAIRVVKLEKFKERLVHSLSGGELQRARIAMALAQRPKIILFDEPTTYLDIAHQLEVMQLIRHINQNFKMTVIMVLHDLNHALQFADEVIVLHGGKILQGTPKNIITAPMLAEVFGVKAETFSNKQGAEIIFPTEIIRQQFS